VRIVEERADGQAVRRARAGHGQAGEGGITGDWERHGFPPGSPPDFRCRMGATGFIFKASCVSASFCMVQDTAPKACGPFWGSVVPSTVQVLPFHDSASVWMVKVPLPLLNWPVAMHVFAAGQEMPAKLLLAAPGGTGTARSQQKNSTICVA